MVFPESEIMSQTAPEESTTPLTVDEFEKKRQEFLGTGLPGDTGTGRPGEILDAMTGEIKRHTDIIDAVEGLATKIGTAGENSDQQTVKKPLAQPRLART